MKFVAKIGIPYLLCILSFPSFGLEMDAVACPDADYIQNKRVSNSPLNTFVLYDVPMIGTATLTCNVPFSTPEPWVGARALVTPFASASGYIRCDYGLTEFNGGQGTNCTLQINTGDSPGGNWVPTGHLAST